MKIVFFGTPSFAAQILQYLLEKGVSVAAIVSQPDRAQGRHLQTSMPAVKQKALEINPEIPVLQPQKASDPQFLLGLETYHADLFVVVAYGQILSQKLLQIPPLGCINVHASLLPKYRGAAPIQRCLMNGDTESGVCIQQMVYALDAGDVIEEAKIPIPPEMTFGELEHQLCNLSKPLLLSVLKKYEHGCPTARPQDSSQITVAPKIKPEETQINWNQNAARIHNRIRALSPRPGAWCWIGNTERRRLKILRAKWLEQKGSPGALIAFEKDQCIVSALDGSLQLLEVQIEGKKVMSAAEWIRGCQTPPSF
ncbi:MAG: Methionyl-tRNA formyltransferase [Parachlamydiales bacterium]|nr:Methionyl-tRNA formyltransferase [Parachlamydiales bacterium]